MLDRHEARLCHRCSAPLARQSSRCWRCDSEWEPVVATAPPRRSLQDSTAQVLSTRARRHADDARRARRPATRAPAARAPKANA